MPENDDVPSTNVATPSPRFWVLAAIGMLAMLSLCVLLALVASRA